jgi:hypothetical protein
LIEAGDLKRRANATISHLSLNAENIGLWRAHNEIPAPFYVDVGGGWLLLSLFGGLLNPMCGLVRTLRNKHTRDWDKAVDLRESYFRADIKNLFREERFVVPDHKMMLRRSDGSQLTDVDAAVLDQQTGSLALIQLKWLDIFGMSLRERDSRRRNLLTANDWIDRVSGWIAGRNAKDVAKALQIAGNFSATKTPLLFVIPRYAARFTMNDTLDARACWLSWPELVKARQEQKDAADPLKNLHSHFINGTTNEKYIRPEDATYEIDDLKIKLLVAQ